ncbi:MAG: hypothetical protein HYY48_10850 [Gammaproteobacteria bacterium]|nr:hypothetical protein [Gammaproteobacteria bacterium]
MISSLLSRFELARPRALFLGAQKAAVYHWRKGDLGTSFLFDANDEGREYFARYLKETPNTPMYVLVDVFEEEFRRDTIPHVFGPDRTAILGRKKSRLFRDTPYFHYFLQGREQEGRRDDRVLLTSITNPNLVRPWVKLLDEHQIPLAGVYSVPLFTKSVLKLLSKPGDHMLVISLQSISGLRQTFIHKGDLRISRLVQMPRYGTEPYGPHIRQEVDKIRRYLNNMRLTTVDDPVDIYLLLGGELLDEMRRHYTDSGLNRYHILDLNELMQAAGSERRVSTPFSDQFFVHELLKQRPSNLYATGSERRYFTMRRLRHSMHAASALLLLGGAAWGGYNFMDGLSYKQRSLADVQKTQFYTARYQMARERLPQTPVEPADIQVAVELADVLNQYKTTPLDMMKVISAALQGEPSVQIDDLQWVASFNPDVELGKEGGVKPGQAALAAPIAVSGQPAYKFYQVAQMSGRLDPFDGNFRNAITTINNFAESLRAMKSVYDVKIVSLPLDVSSTANLQGNVQAQQSEARFIVKLVIGIGHEA